MAKVGKSGESTSPKTRREVDDLLRRAAKPSLSREEIRAQKVSFAMSTQSDGGMTRRQIEELVDQR